MKNNNENLSIIFISIILIVFFGFLVFFLFNSSKELKNNSTNNIINETNIYKENDLIENTEVINIEKREIVLASFTTNIYDTDSNRIYNIKKACKVLNEHRVEPNEEFSFNDKLGNMGEAEGYKKALGFDSNGNKIKVFGGGICQISSTLYNSVLIAKLKVSERHAHSRRVNYVPKDRDATVFAGGPDFKFINTSKFPIIIYASTDGYDVTVTLKQEKIIEKTI